MTTPARRRFAQLAALAAAFCFCVIVFGAFVRLSNAGLACPDWPTCYGQITWPTAAHEIDAANAAYPERPVESHKAWREQVHRFLAGVLILATFGLAAWAIRRRGEPGWPLRAPIAVALLIVFQALLGMWTVTWLLKPVVVMGHLLGGLLTFSLIAWMAWRATDVPIRLAQASTLRLWTLAALALLAVQIALGGWVSANYAALACATDFPKCVGQWWPQADFREGFVLWRGIGVDYEGGVLDGQSRIAIQLAHRAMAVVVFLALVAYALRLWRTPGMRGWALLVLALTVAQVSLGIANVKFALPLWVAVLHNAGAALLLFVLVTLLARVRRPD
jgi:heme a synthase